VTTEIVGLVAVNLAYVVVGAALLVACGWFAWYRVGVAYPLGVVATVVPASYVALFGVPVAITAAAVAVALVAVALWRTWPWHVPRFGRVRVSPVAVVVFVVLAVVLAYAARTFATRPVIEWDSWAIWLAKARLLYDDPGAAPGVLRTGTYGQAPYPLGLPTLEAVGFKAMGQYDGTVIGLQLWFLATAFPFALWSILRVRAQAWTIAFASIAVVAAPQMLFQLMTHYADVPLGLFVGLGVAAGAAWVLSGEAWLLGCFAAFFGMAGVTKSEGFLFALAGCVALLVAAGRPRLRAAGIATAAVLAVILPWRLYCSAYGLATPDYNLGNALRPSYLRAHADRLGPTLGELAHQLGQTSSWGFLTWAVLLAFGAGILAFRWRLLAFAGTWLVLAAGGLVLTYWISTLPTDSHLSNTSYRTIVSLLIGGASVVPLFVFPRREDAP
jgi:hypothetical protein